METKLSVGFIGCGNMALAIGGALLKTGIVLPSTMFVSSPSCRNKSKWEELGVATSNNNGFVLQNADVIFLAFKPHQLDSALTELKDSKKHIECSKLIISVLAGIPLKVLEKKICSVIPASRIIRVLPNTPVLVSAGCAVFACGSMATREDAETVQKIFSSGGICEEVPEEQIDAIGALSGCGPAFVYLVIEALSDGAVKMGVPRSMATKFAAQTVLGASKMVLDCGKHPAVLKDEVCSPGGSTIAGIHSLEKGGVRSAFMDAIEAATRRCHDLGANTKEQ